MYTPVGMEWNILDLDDESAPRAVEDLLAELRGMDAAIESLQRRAGGIRKLIDAVTEMFPAVEDMLPDDLDGQQPRPRGAEAVRRVLANDPGKAYTVGAIVNLLREEGWLPDSSNPSNAVRSAAERAVEQGKVARQKTDDNVYYRVARTEPPAYDDAEEPF